MEYRKVDSLFENVLDNVTEVEKLNEKAYTENECGDDIRILQVYKASMNDGLAFEQCLWAESDMYFLDVSIEKKLLGECSEDKFLKYLEDKGFYLEKVEESDGTRWRYCGFTDMDDVYRISYYQEEDEEEFATALNQFLAEVLGTRGEDDEI